MEPYKLLVRTHHTRHGKPRARASPPRVVVVHVHAGGDGPDMHLAGEHRAVPMVGAIELVDQQEAVVAGGEPGDVSQIQVQIAATIGRRNSRPANGARQVFRLRDIPPASLQAALARYGSARGIVELEVDTNRHRSATPRFW